MLRLHATFLVFALLAAPAVAQQTDEDPVEAFIEASDLDQGTEEFASQLRQLVAMQAGQFPEPAAERYEELMATALATETIEARLRTYLAEHASEEELTSAVAWRSGPTVAPMMDLVDEASTDPAAQVPIQMYATTGQLGRHDVSDEREELVARLLQESGAVASGVNLMADLIVVSSQFNAELLNTEAPNEEFLRAQVGAQFAGEVITPMKGVVLYALREVDDASIGALLEASSNPEARTFHDVAGRAQSYAVVGSLEEAAGEFIRKIEELAAADAFDLETWRAETLARMQQPAMPGTHDHDHDDHDDHDH